MKRLPSLALALVIFAACATETVPSGPTSDLQTLQVAFADHFMVGVAVGTPMYSGEDAQAEALIAAQFNTITPENDLKWERVHPEPDTYDFGPPDRYVALGEANGQFIVGHTLVWHQQTPAWVFTDENGDSLDRERLLARLEDHISTVVGRYRGRIDAWDVVNEALNDDGSMRDTPWKTIIGDDYLEHAFRFAAAADPDAELYYNDYSLENDEKRAGAIALVRSLQEAGVAIHGIGTQGHHLMEEPAPEQQALALQELGELGIPVMVTELDITVLPRDDRVWGADLNMQAQLRDELNPYVGGLPDSVSAALAQRYAALFQVFVDNSDVLSRVTFWSVSDADTWLNGWPIPGRTDYPMLFDRAREPKAAYEAVLATAE